MQPTKTNKELIDHLIDDKHLAFSKCGKCGSINVDLINTETYYYGDEVMDVSNLICLDCKAVCKEIQTWK